MTRGLFITAIILLFALGRTMQIYEVNYTGFIVFALGILLVSLRRIYLELSPWWDAPLEDIAK